MLSDELDELDHQALDLLEDDSAQSGVETDAAATRVAGAFERLAVGEAERVLAALERLAETDPEREVDSSLLAAVRSAVEAEPGLALALSSTVEQIGLGLGLSRDRSAWSLLVARSEAATRSAPAEFERVSAKVAELLREGVAGGSRSLAVFRLATLAGAGPSIRARALAAEHPESHPVAIAVLNALPGGSASELVDAFDAARRAAESPASDEQKPELDGPQRKFTWVHALLAAIVLGLTLWHYLGR